MPATRQVREIAKIEAKLAAPPKTTKAPDPIVPNGQASSPGKDPYDGTSTKAHIEAYLKRKR